MQYILIETESGVLAYQCIRDGRVVAFKNLDGNPFSFVGGSSVVDANPPTPAWHTPDPTPEPEPTPAPASRRLTKLDFVGRLGADFATILTAAKSDVEVELFVKMLDWATPDPDGTSVDLDDARVIYALNTLETGGLIREGRAAEILSA